MKVKKELALAKANQEIFVPKSCLVFFHYHGLDVATLQNLRRQLVKLNGQVYVMKNTLSKLASDQQIREELGSLCKGPLAIAYSVTDPIGLANTMNQFFDSCKKQLPNVKPKFCISGPEIHNPQLLQELAKYKSIDDLRASFLGLLQQPAATFMRLLQMPLANIINLIDAKSKTA